MTFNSKKIVYSLEDNWDELISITFVNDNDYISFNALAYEDEIGVEVNDQINTITVLKNDFKFELLPKSFCVTLKNPIIQNNFSDLDIVVNFQEIDFEKLVRGIKALTAFNDI